MAPLTSRTFTLGYLGAALAASAIAGLLATTGTARAGIVVLGAGAGLVLLLARFGSGCAAGLLILGGLDALPGPNLETTQIANSITAQDFAVAGLLALLFYENGRKTFRPLRSARWGRALVAWSLVFLGWYVATVLRTWLSTPVPLEHAITFSRDFLYFALLLPLLFGPLREPVFRSRALVTLGIGAVVAALAQSAVVASGASLSLLVHTYQTGTSSGLTRLYTSASDIPFAALPVGIGIVLLTESRRLRVAGGVLALSSFLAVLLGLTRAMYVGSAIGLTVATAVIMFSSDSLARLGRRQILRVGGALLLVSAALLIYAPASATTSALSGVSNRVNSVVTDLTSSTVVDSSILAREDEIGEIEAALRGHWVLGLGFLDPTYDYVADAPQGSIRNSDVSLLGSVATVGLIGTAIYGLPLVCLLLGLLHMRWTRRRPTTLAWLTFGGLAWCVAALVASPTLALFFSPAEVVASATMLALVAVLLAESLPAGHQPRGVPADGPALPHLDP